MSKTTFIYALCEPGTRTVRYIGKSENLKKRFRQHLTGSSKNRNHLGDWLRSLSEPPVLVVLHEVAGNESWAEEERRYISCARAIGMDLVNGTDGGEGCSNPTPETRAAISAAKKGVTHSPETRAAMSAARKGVPRGPFSPEHCAAISAARKGEKASPETRAAMSAAHMGKPGRPHLPETRAAMSAAKEGVPWSPARRAAYERRWGVPEPK